MAIAEIGNPFVENTLNTKDIVVPSAAPLIETHHKKERTVQSSMDKLHACSNCSHRFRPESTNQIYKGG